MRRLLPSYFLFHFRNGRFYGFPICCNLWFCAFQWLPDWVFNPPVSIWDRLGGPSDRGYIPCPLHYKHSPHYDSTPIVN